MSESVIESKLFEDSSDDEFVSDQYENNLDDDCLETTSIDTLPKHEKARRLHNLVISVTGRMIKVILHVVKIVCLTTSNKF